MDELFGISMNILMYVLSALFLITAAGVTFMAFKNPIMLKLALRNIPRRRGQTVLIVVGVMLSTVIMSAAFGTGDTLSYSIRDEAITSLRNVDEVITRVRTNDLQIFRVPYFPYEDFEKLADGMADDDAIDGLTPQIGEWVPAKNPGSGISEGSIRMVGLAPPLLSGFRTFEQVTGEAAFLENLADGQGFINESAGEKLEAKRGDIIEVVLPSGSIAIEVQGVIKTGGLAGRDPTILLPLDRIQNIFNQSGKINAILVSNRGDEWSGVEESEEVTSSIRSFFNDPEVAEELKRLLSDVEIIRALEEKIISEDLSDDLNADLSSLVDELSRNGVTHKLNSLLSDQKVVDVVMDELDIDRFKDQSRLAATLFLDLSEFRVTEFKRDLLDIADAVGSAVTSIFVLFSSFSITVGVLLIFLIFVMLAAARKSEMGMARAVGAKRRDLVLMFAFEGAAYAVVSAAVGAVLGLAVSAIMILTMNQIFGNFGEEFRLTIHFELRSIIVAYCLGMIITFGTVGVSAYRVSRLNIVVAIRGLPEAIIPKETRALSLRTKDFGRVLVLPILNIWASIRAVRDQQFNLALRKLAWAVVSVFSLWPFAITLALIRLLQPYLIAGWLTFVFGATAVYFTISSWERISYFGGGVSLMIIGITLMLRWVLRNSDMRGEIVDRLAATLGGLATLAYWMLPFRLLQSVVGDLQGGPDVMFVSGIAMVGAAVWLVMYNADVLLGGTHIITRWFGSLRPVVIIAIAYPLAARFRTGLTLAMFALVIFTLVVMSILTETFSTQFEEHRRIFGGYDIGASINPNTPVVDIRDEIEAAPDLRIEDFHAISGITQSPVKLRSTESGMTEWHNRSVLMVDDEFLSNTDFEFKLVAEGYGPSSRDVLDALRKDPSLAVVGGLLIETAEPSKKEAQDSLFGGLYYGMDRMGSFRLDARESRTGTIVPLTIIAVVDRQHRDSRSVLVSKEVLDQMLPVPMPLTNYRFRMAEGSDVNEIADNLEKSFLNHGMETEVFKDVLEDETSSGKAFFRLFTGFMALGLLVGVAGLGVISTRAVVERRQQIGVLRSIGFRRSMVQSSMLIEASFVSLLGSLIGLALGLILSFNAVTEIRQDGGIDTIRFSVPWLQIAVILGITYLFSLMATFLPARQAAKIYPAEALRYE